MNAKAHGRFPGTGVLRTMWGGPSRGCGGRAAGRAGLALGLLLAGIMLLPATSAAQSGYAASPFLPADHWGHSALARLHGAGLLTDGYDAASLTVTRLEALERFEAAAARAAMDAPGWAALAAAYRDRLAEEFPHTGRRAGAGEVAAGGEGSLIGGVRARRNELLARHAPAPGDEARPVPLGDSDRALGGVELGFDAPAGFLTVAGHAAVVAEGGDVDAAEAYGLVVWRRAGLWAGRRQLGFGASDAGSLALGHGVSFDGAGFFLTDGVRLPGFLRHLGAMRGETFLSRLAMTGQVDSPWFLGLRGSVAPHPRFRLGLTRGVFFSGDSELVPDATLDRLLKVVVGIDTADPGHTNFENHTAAMDAWFVPPLGALPLVLYGEWAVQDLTAQRTEMPAFLYGARLEGVPGVLWLRLGAERATFSDPFANRRPWYDHRVFGTWTDRGTLLGHPLGGVGQENRFYVGLDPLEARLRADARFFSRRRGEGNLFAPERQGSSSGVEGALRWRLTSSMDVEAGGMVERGDDWRAARSFLGGRLHF